MFSSEIRDLTYIALSMIIISSLFLFVAALLNIRSDYANAYNTNMYYRSSMMNQLEFNKYNNTTVLREDVISAIRDYYNTDVRIGVKNKSGVLIYYMDKYVARNPGSTPLSVSDLMSFFNDTNKKYKAVLVYGYANLQDIPQSYTSSGDGVVTAILFFEQ